MYMYALQMYECLGFYPYAQQKRSYFNIHTLLLPIKVCTLLIQAYTINIDDDGDDDDKNQCDGNDLGNAYPIQTKQVQMQMRMHKSEAETLNEVITLFYGIYDIYRFVLHKVTN